MIAIIGAGISGLSLAWFLQKKGIEFVVLESGLKSGGLINTINQGKYILETGPNTILCDEYILNFLKEIGLEDRIVYPSNKSEARYILKKGKYQKLPSNPFSILFSDFFTWKTKASIFMELIRPINNVENETLSMFFERRFGKEILDYVLNPFIAGIYAGDPSTLMLNKTFINLQEYEQLYGSVLKGFIKNKSSKRKLSLNFIDGMKELPIAIASRLKNIKYGVEVNNILKIDEKFHLVTGKGSFLADKVVFTCPTSATSKILKNYDENFSDLINKIEYPPMSIIYTAFKKSEIQFNVNGFGGLNPKIENQFSAGSIWTSSLMPYRAPSDEVLFSTFVGGALYVNNAKLEDETLKMSVSCELKRQYQINGEPTFQFIERLERSLPQYTLILNEVYKIIESYESKGFFFSVNWKEGVSLGDCIKKGEKLAHKLEKDLISM